MTTVTIVRNASDRSYKEFRCFGHARNRRRLLTRDTQDIICASISVLVINTINALEELAGEKPQVTADEETGFIRCVFVDSLSGKGVLLMDALVLGLDGISRQYGDRFLQVKYEEV